MSIERLRALEKDAYFAWQMLSAVCENDPSTDRMKARDAAWNVYSLIAELGQEAPDGDRKPDPEKVICPNCTHQFYAISERDQQRLRTAELGQEVGAVAWGVMYPPSHPQAGQIWTTFVGRSEAVEGRDACWNAGDDLIVPLYTSPAHTSEAMDAEIARLCAQLADMEHGFRDMASKWSHDAAEMTHGIAATAVRSCVDEVFDFLGPDYDAAMRQEGGTP